MSNNSNNYCFFCGESAQDKCPHCTEDNAAFFCCQAHLDLHRSSGACNPFIIQSSENVGRFMVASRDIYPGETIFQDQAIVVGASAESLPACLNCHGKLDEKSHIRCSVCKFPLCSAECCQTGAEHLAVCEYLKDRGSAISTFDQIHPIYSAIVPLKIIILKLKQPEKFALLDKLMDHKKERISFPDYWAGVKTNIVDFILGLDKKIETTEEEILRIVGIMDTNAHEIGSRHGISFKGVFPMVALLSHQCIVNSRQIMQKNEPYLNTCRANVFIAKGQEILTTYIWPHTATRARRNSLREGWHFDCNCSRCADPCELGAFTSALLCLACPRGFLLQENPLELREDKATWRCQACGLAQPSQDIQRLILGLTNQVESLDRSNLEANLQLLQTCRQSLHKNHALCTELRARIIPIMTRQAGVPLESILDEKLEWKRSLAKENLDVFNIIAPGFSKQRGGLLFELQESEYFIAKRQIERGQISQKEFVDKLKQCKKLLLECTKCLFHERSNSLEEFYELSAKVSLKAVVELIFMFSN